MSCLPRFIELHRFRPAPVVHLACQVIVLLSGLTAAAVWTGGILASSRLVRHASSAAALAWVSILELVVMGPILWVGAAPHSVDGSTIIWLLLSGAMSTIASYFSYSAMKDGKVGIVAPIISVEGAVAAVIAVFGGEVLGFHTLLLLALITAGVLLASVVKGRGPDAGHPTMATVFAVVCALSSGTNLYAIGRLSSDFPVAWALLPARAAGALLFTVPLFLSRRMQISHRGFVFAVLAGTGELLGFGAYAYGSRHGIAITAVTASLFAPFAALAAFLIFRDRLSRLQIVGIATIAIGIAVLAGASPA